MISNSQTPWPSYSKEEIDAVQSVLQSGKVNYWTGEECHFFEKEFARFCNTRYAIALANGSVALELALRALHIGVGDEVIVTCRTFLASVSAIVAVGGIPVFSDVDPDSQNCTAATLAAVLTTRTKAIITVHLAGWPCDMDPILELAKTHELSIVEDCAQAHGAKYKGRPVGSIGDVAAWSFCQDKIMTTGGEGGMVTTNNHALWSRMWSYKDHGKSWHAVYEKDHQPHQGFRWLHDSFGSNYRMTEMQAAIGRIQLKRMEDWHFARCANAQKILNVAKLFPSMLRAPNPSNELGHAWYKCYLFIKPDSLAIGWDRDRIVSEINQHNVPCFSGTCSEVYLEKAFDGTGFRPTHRLPVAQQLGETSLMFLVHPNMTESEISMTCSVLKKILSRASL